MDCSVLIAYSPTSLVTPQPSSPTATACMSALGGSAAIHRRVESECSYLVATQLPYQAQIVYSTLHQVCSTPVPRNSVRDFNGEAQPPPSATDSHRPSQVWIVAPVIVVVAILAYCAWTYCFRDRLSRNRGRQRARRSRTISRQQDPGQTIRLPVQGHQPGVRTETIRFYDYREQRWISGRVADSRGNNNGEGDVRLIIPAPIRIQRPAIHEGPGRQSRLRPPPVHPPPVHPPPVHPPPVHPPPVHPPPVHPPPVRPPPVRPPPVCPPPVCPPPVHPPPVQSPSFNPWAVDPPSIHPHPYHQPHAHPSPAQSPHIAPSSASPRSAWNEIRTARRHAELQGPSIASLAVESSATQTPPAISSDFSSHTLTSSGSSRGKHAQKHGSVDLGTEQMDVDDRRVEGGDEGGGRRDLVQWILETLGVFQMGRLIWRAGREDRV